MKVRRVLSFMGILMLISISVLSVVGCKKSASTSKQLTIAMLPKFKGENYFDAAKKGAEEAAAELGIKLLYDGPLQSDTNNAKQVEILDAWIAQRVDAIIVSPIDAKAIKPTLDKAREKKIKIVTYDADTADPSARDFFVNQATSDDIAKGLIDAVVPRLKAMGYGDGKNANLAMISGSGTDANQTAWENSIKSMIGAGHTHPWLILDLATDGDGIYHPGSSEEGANSAADSMMTRVGNTPDKVQAVLALSSMSTPAVGAAYNRISGTKPTGFVMAGLATPLGIKTYLLDESNPLHDGVLWNVVDLGYLAVQATVQALKGTITETSTTMTAGRLGAKNINNREILLGPALIFNKDNVNNFNY